MREFTLCGKINNSGVYEIDEKISLIDIFFKFAGGLWDSRRLSMVQIGGPFGEFVLLKDIEKPLSDYTKNIDINTILFLNDLTCPVDYARFCVRYLIRELRTTNETIEEIEQIIEKISNGTSKRVLELDILKELLEEETVIPAERKMKKTVLFLLNNFRNIFEEHIAEKKCYLGICHRLASAQCINACPAEVNIPGYVAYMAEGDMEKAYAVMRQSNPLSYVCGLICARPCENRCRRGELEQTVGVRSLKYFASTMALEKQEVDEDSLEDNGKKVAIIGSGPAGLSSAYFLARSGYSVTVYEAEKVAGGVPAIMIPEYRISNEAINREVKLIEDLGVQVKTGVKVGVDIKLSEIRKTHDITILATGLMNGNKVGPDKSYIVSAVDILKKIKLEGKRDFPKKVTVIGGGDVAMDSARSIMRCGSEVTVVSLEEYDKMPASHEEKNGAVEEGINFLSGYTIKKYCEEGNSLSNIEVKKCLSTMDNQYKFNPVFDEDDTVKLDSDLIVMAIGQRADYGYIDNDIEIGDNRWIKFDKNIYKTTANDVYVAGDMGGFSKVAISAIAEGKKVAISVDKALGGRGIYTGEEISIPMKPLDLTTWDIPKQEERETCATHRCNNFDNVKVLYSKEEAIKEATRCMRCDRNSKQ